MLRTYFKIALRHLRKNKLYAFVNIAGLAIGIASCLLIGIYIFDEFRYDAFHKNKDRIVRLTMEYNAGDAENKSALTGTKAGPQLQRTFPQVLAYVRTLKYPRVIRYADNVFEEKNFLYADSAFFSVFSFTLLSGDRKTVLDAPDKVVLTQSATKKYFGSENPLGKTMRVGTREMLVSGVVADAPHNSQIQFDLIGSFTSLSASKEEDWWSANYITYLMLQDKHAIGGLQQQVRGYMKTVSETELKMTGNSYLTYHVEPFTDVHLHSPLEGFEPNNDIVYIYILAAIAFLILVIACVNYTNLSIAQSAGRNAEIGVRKVLGADRQQVFHQFISEAFVVTLIAVLLALAISALLLPYFNELAGKQLPYAVLFGRQTIGIILLLGLIVALCAGLYPALVMSRGNVISILKQGFTFTGSGRLRKSLIVVQFVISIFLITATIVILQQLSFIHNKDLGYSKDQVMVLPLDAEMEKNYDAIKQRLAGTPGVVSVGAAYEPPTHVGWSDGIMESSRGAEKRLTVNAIPCDEDFVKTLGLQIIAGSDFNMSDVKAFDTSDDGRNLHHTYMLNESAVKALGWTPEEAIGKTITKATSGIVKAVVKDFHFRSFHEPITPLILFMDRRMVNHFFIKINNTNTKAAISRLEQVWKERVPHRPFEYHFLDEDFDRLYKAEQRTAGVFATFSTVAIVLACLGLFALTAFAMVQRTKEIGIRKILGATVTHILALVSKDFIKLIFIALCIALPVAWFAITKWLDRFVYKTAVHWWVFVLAALVILVIAFITISLQAIKTAVANPVKNLRTE
jgi:putative ABC transport system permease protein